MQKCFIKTLSYKNAFSKLKVHKSSISIKIKTTQCIYLFKPV